MRDPFPLPTLDYLKVSLPSNVDAKQIAKDWFASFSKHAQAGDVQGVLDGFTEESYWRDMLALTWDFRTFVGTPSIRQFLNDRLGSLQLHDLKLREDQYLQLQQPFPDVAWIQFMFDFKVGSVGTGMGIGRLIPQSNGSWRCQCIYTNLEDLQAFPEKIGALRNIEPNHGLWVAQRQKEVAFEDTEPTALIVGGGQSGLDVAARLKALGVNHLIIEKNPRIGDSWRNRYEALCLHDPVWYDHMPYLPFPPNWPAYSPSVKLAGWLESYAEFMELNVWTSSTVESASLDSKTNEWKVVVRKGDGTERVFEHIKHLIFATGLAGGEPNIPSYPGTDVFKGQILHSSQHKRASDHVGKKVVVIGACTSGLYSENAPPTDIADRLNASFPNVFMGSGMAQRATKYIAELDKPLLEALNKRGFRTNLGLNDTGFAQLAWSKAGGYYLDVGASQMIVDGKIKLKNDSKLERFTETGLKFEDGSELPADVVMFATGYGDARTLVRRICGEELGKKVKPIWGLNEEGEINGLWRDLGVPGLWYMMGNLALARFHSKHIALQIKAMEEGVFGTRYEE
ncbi:hypothetical protein VNI00_012910 [Paramarasmius palmivorus]|uniref:Flavin-containing monooxygenase n=1 Tax=Paramarasmius palmivorus TaxID=297713 RepID=A0AAW0C199_9AGAR